MYTVITVNRRKFNTLRSKSTSLGGDNCLDSTVPTSRTQRRSQASARMDTTDSSCGGHAFKSVILFISRFGYGLSSGDCVTLLAEANKTCFSLIYVNYWTKNRKFYLFLGVLSSSKCLSKRKP